MVSAERVFKRNVFRGLLVYIALLGIAWCWLFPIAWAVSGSLKREGEVTEPRPSAWPTMRARDIQC